MTAPPLISVIVPTYNSVAFVEATMNSILAQTFKGFELIVTDDASKDGTLEVVKRFTDPRIRVHTFASNVGPGANANRGLAVARGKYVKVVGADDILYPRCLELQVGIMERPEYDHVGLISCARDIIDETDKIIHRPTPILKGFLSGQQAVRQAFRTGGNAIGEPFAVLFRSSLTTRLGGFDDSIPFMFDMLTWSRLLKGGDFFLLSEPLGAFRISRQSLSFRLLGQHSIQYFRALRRIYADPSHHFTIADFAIGSVRCAIRELLRTAAYQYYLESQ